VSLQETLDAYRADLAGILSRIDRSCELVEKYGNCGFRAHDLMRSTALLAAKDEEFARLLAASLQVCAAICKERSPEQGLFEKLRAEARDAAAEAGALSKSLGLKLRMEALK
jgi:hypothetical protein